MVVPEKTRMPASQAAPARPAGEVRMEIPEEWRPVAEGVNKMRDLMALALRRGLFASVEENAEYLGGYSQLELEVKKRIFADADKPGAAPLEAAPQDSE